MSRGFRFELNRKGVRELLKSQEAMALVRSYANDIQRRAGDGYEVTGYAGKNRVNASVMAMTKEARQDNLDNNTLLKAMGR